MQKSESHRGQWPEKSISRLHFITLDQYRVPHAEQVLAACKAGVKWVQLRMKQAEKEAILREAGKAREICDKYRARLIINDHVDIALRCRADGLHLGNDDMPVCKARAITGPDMIIGGTANTPADALKRIEQGADYVGAGPFRFTRTKKNLAPILEKAGIAAILETLRTERIDRPVIAVGGIMLEDLRDLLGLPLHGIAVSGLIARASCPEQTVRAIEEIFETRNHYVKDCR